MKILISTVAFVTTIFAVAEPREFKKDIVIYEATVKGKKITVFLSESPFDPEKHKITPGGVKGEGYDARSFFPKLDG